MTLLFVLLTAFAGIDLAEQKVNLEKELLTSENPGEIHIELSRILTSLGDPKKGVSHAKKAIALLPESAKAHHRYSVALRHKMEKSPVSWLGGKGTYIKHLEKAMALDPSFAPAYVELANFHLQAPAFLGAEAKKAMKLGETLTQYDLKRGARLVLDALGKQNDANGRMKALKGFIEKMPDDPDFRLDMSLVLQEQEKYQEALGYLEGFLEGKSLHKPSLYQAGRARILGGFELEEAAAIMGRYAEIADGNDIPTASDALWRQGLAYKAMNRPDDARSSFYKALSLNSEHEESRKALDAMQ